MTNEEIIKEYQAGNNKRDCLEKLYMQNHKLITHVARKYTAYELPEDLQQVGFEGLAVAAELWQEDGGASFSSYATYWIRQKIIRHVDSYGSCLRVPVGRRQRVLKYKNRVNSFRMNWGRDPSTTELAALLEVTADKIEEIKADALAVNVNSLDETFDEDENLTMLDTVSDPRAEQAFEDKLDEIQNDELAVLLWGIVDDLGEKPAHVLRMRYGSGYTLKQCGDVLGVSISRVKTIETEALRKMKTGKRRKQLEEYSDTVEQLAYQGTGYGTYTHTGSSAPERAVIRLEELEERRHERE